MSGDSSPPKLMPTGQRAREDADLVSLQVTSSIIELLFVLYFLYDFVVRGGRVRRFLWKLALYLALLLPGVAALNLEFTSQVQVDVSMSFLASILVSTSIWIVVFDPDISPTLTLLQLGTLVLSISVSIAILLSLREEGTWAEQREHLFMLPGVIGKFMIRLPWDGPHIAMGLYRAIAWLIKTYHFEVDDFAPKDKLHWLNRTVEINGTVFVLS